jgi:hypothetical protein
MGCLLGLNLDHPMVLFVLLYLKLQQVSQDDLGLLLPW